MAQETEAKTGLTATEQVAWTEDLPEGGGAWGKSIRSTAEQMERELIDLEKLKAEVTEKVAGRKKILTETTKRADKEAKLLYSNKAIEAAHANRGSRPQVKAEKVKAKPKPTGREPGKSATA